MYLGVKHYMKEIDIMGQIFWCGFFFGRYTIEDLVVARKYNVSMTLKLCFEASDDNLCLYSVDVFSHTLLPKRICDWEAGFSEPG